jgi:hypothetical protein
VSASKFEWARCARSGDVGSQRLTAPGARKPSRSALCKLSDRPHLRANRSVLHWPC